MFTVKHVNGSRVKVDACDRYERSLRDGKHVILLHSKAGSNELVVSDGVVYIENALGKTIDIVKPN